MASNRTELIIEAVDRASSTLTSIDSKVDSLGSNVGGLAGQFGVASFAGEAAFKAVEAAINLAGEAVGFFVDNLQKAADVQTQNIATAANIGALVGGGLDQNLEIVQKLTDAIVEQTSALPGLTQEYQNIGQSILDNVIPAARDAAGNLDPDKLVQYTTELSRAFGLLGQSAGLNSSDVNLGLGRALSGGSIAELRQLGLFERNPALLTALQDELTKRGVAELKDLDAAARVDIIRQLGNRFITDETVSALSQTFNGQIEGFLSSLFDPNSGIFGFAKKLSGRGDKSIIDAATVVLDQIFTLFGQVAQISFDAFGITGEDITEAIYDIVVWFSGLVTNISEYITDPQNQADITARLQAIGNFLNNIKETFEQIYPIVSNIFESIGALLAVVIDFADFIAGILSGNKEQAEQAKSRLDESILNFFTQVAENIVDFFNFVKSSLENAKNNAQNLLQSIASSVTASQTVTPTNNTPLSSTTSADVAAQSTGNPGSSARYAGQIPGIGTEKAMMPGGSSVVAANSSEYIFTPDQMNNLVQGLMAGGSPVFNININGNADQNTIDELLRELDRKWNEYRGTYQAKIIKPA